MSAREPLSEDLAAIEELTSELTHLEKERAEAAERLALLRADRDEAARQVLSLEPDGPLTHVPVALVLGSATGAALCWWWLSLPYSESFPRLSAALAIGSSTLVLLRGAWRSGRISGARGAG